MNMVMCVAPKERSLRSLAPALLALPVGETRVSTGFVDRSIDYALAG
jgi:hypothetical protein